MEKDIIIENIYSCLKKIKESKGDINIINKQKLFIKSEIEDYTNLIEGKEVNIVLMEEKEEEKLNTPINSIKNKLFTLDDVYGEADYLAYRTKVRIEIIDIVDDYVEALFAYTIDDFTKVKGKKMNDNK